MEYIFGGQIKKIIPCENNYSLKNMAMNCIFHTMCNNVKYYGSNNNYIESDDDKKDLVQVKNRDKLYVNRELINSGKCSQILNLPKKMGYHIIKYIIKDFNFNYICDYYSSYHMDRSKIFNQHFNKCAIFFINHICPYIESVDFCDTPIYNTVYENPHGSGFIILRLYSKAIDITVNLINEQKMKFNNSYNSMINHVLLYLYGDDDNILYIEADPAGGREKTYKTIATKDNIYKAFSYINTDDNRNIGNMIINSWLNN